MKLRLATYNVHKCRGMDGRTSTARIADVLRELSADVFALQEVMGDQAESLSREIDMPFVIGENRRHRGEAYGNVVFTRLPIAGWRNYDLSVAGREPRGCLRADLVAIEGEVLLHVFNVHLGTSHGERRHQGRKLVAEDLLSDMELEHPRVVLGDFNEWTRGLTTRLLRSHMKSAEVRWRSYPGFLPLLQLDHMYYDEALRLVHFAVHRTRKALVASDHLPLVGDFECGAGEQPELAAPKGNGSK